MCDNDRRLSIFGWRGNKRRATRQPINNPRSDRSPPTALAGGRGPSLRRRGVRGGCGRHAPPHKPSGGGWGKGPQTAPLPMLEGGAGGMRPRKSSTGVGVSECWRGRGPRQHPVTPTPVTALPFKRLPPWGYRVGVRGGCGRHEPPHKPSGGGWGRGPQPAPLPPVEGGAGGMSPRISPAAVVGGGGPNLRRYRQ